MSWLLLASLSACNLLPGLPPIADGPRFLPATATELATVDAVLPSDIEVRSDGGFVVLDGYAGRLHAFSADGDPQPGTLCAGPTRCGAARSRAGRRRVLGG